jgi:hypothetical protein
MGVGQRHAVLGAAVGLGCLCCRRWALGSGHGHALPVSHRTDFGSTGDAGAGVRVLPGGLQRRTAGPRGGLSGGDQTVRQRDSAPRHHPGQEDDRASVVVRGTQCGVGAVGQRFSPCLAQLLRLNHRETQGPQAGSAANEVPQGSPAGVPAHPQRILRAAQWAVVCGQGRRGPGALVTRSAVRAVLGHHHPRTRWPLLRQFRPRRASLTTAAGRAGGRGGCWPGQVGDDRGNRRHSSRCCESEAFGPQAAQAGALGAGEVAPAERISQQRQVAAQSRYRAQQGGPVLGATITTSRLWRWFARTK